MLRHVANVDLTCLYIACFQPSALTPHTLSSVALRPQRPQIDCIGISDRPERLRVIHLLAMRQLMHHDHFDHTLGQPSSVSVSQHKLDDLTSIEVAANEFGIVGELFECLHENHVGFHERIAYRGDSAQNPFGGGRGRSGNRAYKVDQRVRSLGALIDALEAQRHDGSVRLRLKTVWEQRLGVLERAPDSQVHCL